MSIIPEEVCCPPRRPIGISLLFRERPNNLRPCFVILVQVIRSRSPFTLSQLKGYIAASSPPFDLSSA